jgi:hypothetical protein
MHLHYKDKSAFMFRGKYIFFVNKSYETHKYGCGKVQRIRYADSSGTAEGKRQNTTASWAHSLKRTQVT